MKLIQRRGLPILLALLCVAGFGLGAKPTGLIQAQDNALVARAIGPGSDTSGEIAVGDFDQDGRLDLVIGGFDSSTLYLNQADGSLAEAGAVGPGSDHIVPADLDRDGDLDLIVDGVVYTNNGLGDYAESQELGFDVLAAGDVDGDSAIDLIAADGVYLNQGDGTISVDAPRPPLPLSEPAALGDLDGDGDLDLASVDDRTRVSVFSNDGAGAFSPLPLVGDQWFITSLALGDVDGDGDLDLVTGNRLDGNRNTIYLNNGDATFSAEQFFGEEGDNTTSLALGDVDNDGDLDIAAGNDINNGGGEQDYLYLNDGTGNYLERLGFGSGGDDTLTVLLADIDGNMSLDIISGNYDQYTIISSIQFPTPVSRTGNFGADDLARNSAAAGDLDANGTIDLVLGTESEQTYVYLTNSAGLTIAERALGPAGARTRSVALGDLDGDADLDIVTGNWGEPGRAYLNDGGAQFTALAPYVSDDLIEQVLLGDMDGDSDLDLIAIPFTYFNRECSCYLGGAATVYLNNGQGLFSQAIPFGTDLEIDRAALGDIEGDGDLDLIASRSFAATLVFENTGSGELIPAVNLLDSGIADVALLDVDNDDDTDILTVSRYNEHALFINGGGGFFTDLRLLDGTRTPVRGVLPGDVTGDGFIDLLFYDTFGYALFLNDGAGNFTEAAYVSTVNVAADLVDYNRDGLLDLLTLQAVQINDGTGNASTALRYGPTADDTELRAGDIDNDGDLDLIVASSPLNKVYLNDGAGHFHSGTTTCGVTAAVLCIDAPLGQLADMDGDADLDLVAPGVVSLNDGSGRFPRRVRYAAEDLTLETTAVGDLDRDGDLDLVTGYSVRYSSTCDCFQGGLETIHLNDGSGTFGDPLPLGVGGDETASVSLSDLDADGDLDVIVGNKDYARAVNRGLDAIYLNRGDATFEPAILFGDPSGSTIAIIPGDFDGDGDVDLAVGNDGQQNAVFLNHEGTFSNSLPFGRGNDDTEAMVALDWDNDGDLDLAVDYAFEPTVLMINDGAGQLSIRRLLEVGPSIEEMNGIIAGDLDRDGDTDLATASAYDGEATIRDSSGRSGGLYLNGLYPQQHLPQNAPSVRVAPPPGSLLVPGFADGALHASRVLSLTFYLADAEGDPVRSVRGMYSLNGGGSWIAAVPTPGTPLTNLAAPPGGAGYVFAWDTFASGFFGQSDQVVFRIEAEPAVRPAVGTVAGPYQRPFVAATTLPFRARGTQVRVLDEAGQPVAGALVYRLPAGQSRGAAPLADGSGRPFRTDAQGYLAGRSALAVGPAGDQLVALRPVVITDTYTLYHTSAPVGERGLALAPLASPGVQTLTVSPQRPLLLFNLDVALEWDARSDPQFLARLRDDLRRTSEILYDWSDGQAALGEVAIFHDARRLRYDGGWDLWSYANLRVYATNRLRPNANKGGVVSEPTPDPTVAGVSYDPGQIRIGAVWNRYGEASGTIGEDWPRTLAHELGHYLFALDENYLGLNAEGVLVAVEGCRGGMADPYRDDYSEFHPRDAEWQARCQGTLSQQLNGRSDWESIQAFYPDAGLAAPAAFGANRGPGLLPLAVTQISEAPVITPTRALDVPIFSLEVDGAAVQPGLSARAFLLRDEMLLDLGRPVLDRVEARGAEPGDRLCVFEPAAGRLGCETISVGDQTLALQARPDWQPDLAITPVTSRTLTIDVGGLPAGLPLRARLYPTDFAAGPAVELTYAGGAYRGTFGPESMAEPVFEGLVRLWVADGSGRETVVDFAVGGNPGKRWGRTAPRGDPGKRWGRTAPRGNPGKRWGRTAPVISSDGQVILFTDAEFAEGEFYSFQTVNAPPNAPSWTTTVGQAYRLTATANAPSLAEASISFGYLQREVPAGQEGGLTIYHYDGATWQALPTARDPETNTASAPLRGAGVYALMASVEVELRNAGWNYVRYPGVTAPAGAALGGLIAQLSGGDRLIVYADQGAAAQPRWQLYATGVPTYVNTLERLAFQQDYYLWVPRATALPVRGDAAPAGAFAQPPATFYGAVIGGAGLTPGAGMPVVARVGATVCGSGSTRLVGGQIVYAVAVDAEGTRAGCGAPGSPVRFEVAGRSLSGAGVWDDSRVQALDLRPEPERSRIQIYLPLLHR